MKINTALILCAGYGKRLHPITLKNPKPLLKLNNKTLLENTINLIKNLGINNIKLNTFYLKDQIKNFLKEQNFDLQIEIIEDGNKILDTGGGIFNMIKSSNEKNYLVFNPDTIWNSDYVDDIRKMENIYFSKEIKNILMVVDKKLSFDKNLDGDFDFTNGKLARNKIKNYIFTGCQIINKELFSSLQNKNFSILNIWNDLIKKEKLHGFESKNKFYHITDLEIYKKLIKK